MSLVRFRANPQKVRVAIRQIPDGQWLVQVDAVDDRGHAMTAKTVGAPKAPRSAVMRALQMIKRADGVDLGMGTTYEHPFGAENSVK